MSSDSHIELDGEVINCARGGLFQIQCDAGLVVTARLSGRMRKNKIRIVLGDKVKVNVSPYDSSRGIITFRNR